MSRSGNFVKLISLLTVLFLLVFTFASCGSSKAARDEAYFDSYSGNISASDSSMNFVEMEKPLEDVYYSEVSSGSALNPGASTADPLAGRKIIKTVNVVSETKSFEVTLAAIEQEVATLGGYVQSSNSYGKSYEKYSDRRASFTLRIPADKLDAFMSTVGTLVNITSKTTKVDDITDTYTDVEARLNALKVEEARLLELLAKGENLSDLLTIEERLSYVRYEIESYTARIRGYDTLIAFSTVNLEVCEVVDYTPEPIKDPTFGDRIGEAFSDSWKDFAESFKDFTVWFVYSIPSLLMFALFIVAVIVVIIIVKRKRKRRALNAQNENEQNK